MERGRIKEFLWYFSGMFIPFAISFVKSPIFTRYFSTSEYGLFAIVSITFSLLSATIYTSITSCIWRYYNQYKSNNTLTNLYSAIFLYYIVGTVIIIIFSIIWTVLSNNIQIANLIWLCFGQYAILGLIGNFLVILKIEGKAKLYNILYSCRFAMSFGILILLTFVFQMRIEALILADLLAAFLTLILIFICFPVKYRVSIAPINLKTVKEFLFYSAASLFLNFIFTMLNFSDRYIIGIYSSFDEVGIYNQVYNLCQISITAIAGVYLSTITSKFNRFLESGTQHLDRVIQIYIKEYFILVFPATFLLSLFHREVATVLLGKAFHDGHTMIPFVMLSAFILGLSQIPEMKLKFANKINKVLFSASAALIINFALNFLLIPAINYKIASITTLICNLFLIFMYLKMSQVTIFNSNKNNKIYLKILTITISEIVLDLLISHFFIPQKNIVFVIVEGILFFSIFYLLLIPSKIISAILSLKFLRNSSDAKKIFSKRP